MSSFNFRLQRLLGYRNILEEEAKRELGLRRSAMEQEVKRLNGLKQEEIKILQQWSEQLNYRIELPRLQATQEYSRLLERRLLNQAEEYKKTKDRVEEQREIATQCWRKKRMLEILKGKAHLEHRHYEKKLETNLIDEIVLNSYQRKGGD